MSFDIEKTIRDIDEANQWEEFSPCDDHIDDLMADGMSFEDAKTETIRYYTENGWDVWFVIHEHGQGASKFS